MWGWVQMFGRITTGAYLPLPEVSLECQDLIARMLQPVATSRATAAEVMRHPWFATGYAAASPSSPLRPRPRPGCCPCVCPCASSNSLTRCSLSSSESLPRTDFTNPMEE